MCLMNLMKLYLHNNFFEQEIPQNLCELNIDWSNDSYFSIYNNQLCPPYPECIEEFIGYQDNYECGECSFYLGDINDDGAINVLDVVLIIGFIIGSNSPSDSEFLAGDYNEDGELNVLDVVAIISLIIN